MSDPKLFEAVVRPDLLTFKKQVYSINLAWAEELSGIYFLTYRGEVVYVGQSVNVLSRVSSHLSDAMIAESPAKKIFDGAYFIRAQKENLDGLEAHYIELHKPIYNKAKMKIKHAVMHVLN